MADTQPSEGPKRPLPPCLDGPTGRCFKRHSRVMQILHDLARDLAAKLNQEDKFSRCLATLEKEAGLSHSSLMLLSPEGDELRMQAHGSGKKASSDSAKYRSGEGITGKVLASGKTVAVPRIAEDSRFQGRLFQRSDEERESLGFICTPIILDEETIGTLSVDVPSGDALQLRDTVAMLEILCTMVAHDVAMQRMVVHEQEISSHERRRRLAESADGYQPSNLIGNSQAMRDAYTRIYQVAPTDTTVLIRGETGTGKELVASAIHQASPRAEKPFIKVNCAALNENLLESELFGHEKGAFTGALYQRRGPIEEAEGGTLFLDEIGDFSPAIQVKLLRLLQEKEYERVGSNETLSANVRIITATNVVLEDAVREGKFRSDLFYRISVFPIHVAPLRKRKTDILQLANHFVEKYAARMGKPVRRVSTPAINMLTAYHWPGNVRELENCIEHAILLTSNETIKGQDLPPTLQFPTRIVSDEAISLKDRVEIVERDCIVDSLKRYHGYVTAAARELGITPRMVRYKIEKLDIPPPDKFKKRQAG